MQVLKLGKQHFYALELDPELVARITEQAGFTSKVTDGKRGLVVELTAEAKEGPLLLFDAADPANLGWFSRCQFYVDGRTGAVLQTPFELANQRDARGRLLANSVRIKIAKELPAGFRLAGRQPVNEQAIYAVFATFLAALVQTGVAICGAGAVKPLAGRLEEAALRS